MSPFGPYKDFADCISRNGDKASPEGFCAWLEHRITGQWPGEMSCSAMPGELFQVFVEAYEVKRNEGADDRDAYDSAVKHLESMGWVNTQRGWSKLIGSQMQAPELKTISNVKIFSTGEHTDSMGITRKWDKAKLDKMVDAFIANVPIIVSLKAGHTADSFNREIAKKLSVPVEIITGDGGKGQCSLGRMSKLERKGDLLIASFENVPEPIANLIESGMYSTVSVEIEESVGDFEFVITDVALLGVEEPAVKAARLDRVNVFGAPRKGAIVFSESKDSLQNNQEGNVEEIKAIAKGLGLPETATLEEILAAIASLIEQTTKMPEAMKEFSSMKETLKTQAEMIKRFEHQQRVESYLKITSAFSAIQGKPEDMAKELAEVEEKAGKEIADKIVASYQAANTASQAALKVIGSTKPGQKSDIKNTHAFAKKVEARAGEKKISFPEALVQLQIEDPAGYREYYRAVSDEREE